MANLRHTRIYRGGVTAPCLTVESHSCSLDVNSKENSLDFRFHLRSKGGGTTEVLLRLGPNDLPVLVESIAKVEKSITTI